MKNLTTYLVLLTLLFSFRTFAGDEIHFIGFNTFDQENMAQSNKTFDNYITQLMPIMARHGMTYEMYNVKHGGSEALNADVITFGSIKNMQTFQTFFQDPALHAIMPMLEQALSQHQVVFTRDAMEKHHDASAHTLLSLQWLEGQPQQTSATLSAMTKNISERFSHYGVKKALASQGLMSNKGLGKDNQQTQPPHQVELWSINDAHGFFDDPKVVEFDRKIKQYIQRSENFWLKQRLIN